jgi:hypothetical protein
VSGASDKERRRPAVPSTQRAQARGEHAHITNAAPSSIKQCYRPNGFAAIFSTSAGLYPNEAVLANVEETALVRAMDLSCAAVMHGVARGPPQENQITAARHACHDEPYKGESTRRCCGKDKRKHVDDISPELSPDLYPSFTRNIVHGHLKVVPSLDAFESILRRARLHLSSPHPQTSLTPHPHFVAARHPTGDTLVAHAYHDDHSGVFTTA